MSVSMVVLASRPPDWTRQQFTDWWRGPHADAARRLPGLRAYRHGAVTDDYAKPGEEPGWDGHAVLTFDDKASLDAAMASSEWKEATAHAAGLKGKRILVITEEVDLLAGRGDV